MECNRFSDKRRIQHRVQELCGEQVRGSNPGFFAGHMDTLS